MKRKNTIVDRLDLLLTAMEDDILATDDRELLASDDASQVSIEETRSLVHRALQAATRRVPADFRGRLEFIRSLLRSQPDLPVALSASFTFGQTPSEAEVNELIEDLVRSGIVDHSKRRKTGTPRKPDKLRSNANLQWPRKPRTSRKR